MAVIHSASTAGERIWRAGLEDIVETTAGTVLSPCIIVVGEVAGQKPTIVV